MVLMQFTAANKKILVNLSVNFTFFDRRERYSIQHKTYIDGHSIICYEFTLCCLCKSYIVTVGDCCIRATCDASVFH